MKKRVLIVDDVEFNIEFEEKVIKSLMDELDIDIEIDSAYTVKDALSKIAENDPYDAMVVDMNLPDGSGVDIAKAALKKSEDTRLAALTIYPSKYEDQRAFFDLFLRKPIMPNTYKNNFARLLRV
ncbi:MAG: response regulator [Campylobacterota bacterium]|nr:response regulator [Campylobacterota bacterium]